jgi:hypothetical protein
MRDGSIGILDLLVRLLIEVVCVVMIVALLVAGAMRVLS